jgi:hypothetical protein
MVGLQRQSTPQRADHGILPFDRLLKGHRIVGNRSNDNLQSLMLDLELRRVTNVRGHLVPRSQRLSHNVLASATGRAQNEQPLHTR